MRLVQDRHLESIRAADLLWLICPDGYVGQSASLELGYAIAEGIPIYGTRAPSDLTLREYVTVIATLSEALNRVAAKSRPRHPERLLIDPHASVEEAHAILERIETALTRPNGVGEPGRGVYRDVADLQTKLGQPAYIQ